tara:strand:+ start:504 stop:710 length:207 start_codon:yes stop_codon:yes gene_type:complete
MFAITGKEETIKNLNNPIKSDKPFNLLFLKVKELFIRKLELAALITANGKILIKEKFVAHIKKYNTNN